MTMALRACAFLLLAAGLLPSSAAFAQTYGSCTVSTSTIALGTASSLVLATDSRQASGSSGFACSLLTVLSTNYVRVRLDSSTLRLTGQGLPVDASIPFVVSATANGPAIAVGTESTYVTTDLLNLFLGPGNSIPLYVRTQPTAALRAGTYTGSVVLRWYFSICSVGIGGICVPSQSPGFNRNANPVVWGTGVPVTVNISLTVTNDCVINAPALSFGTAPLVASFNPVSGAVFIRCSAGAAYTVGLGNGANYSGGWRRMRRGVTGDYLRYEIYKGPSAPTQRWGGVGTERRGSAGAEGFAGVYDGTTQQQFIYRAVIDPTQSTPTAGTYLDTVVVDVQF